MNHSDKHAFAELFHGLADYYYPGKAGKDNPKRLGKMALQLTFAALEEYSIDQLSQAATAHVKDPENGRFMPVVAHLIKHLEGGTITADMIVAAAKLAETPLGVLARIHIGTWDLNNRNSFDLKQRAEEVLQLLPNWKAKSQSGDYTDHELTMMMKHGVDPVRSGFYHGLALPSNRERLITRVLEIQDSPRYKELTEPAYQPEPSKAVPLAKTLAKLENDDA